jgi:secreted trypsin-like serine protease
MAAGSGMDQMQEATVTVVSDEVAAKSYPSNFIPEFMIAAGEAGKGGCNGDSGGPMFARPIPLRKPPAGAPPKPYSQYGITSFGKKTCGPEPTVFTEVNHPMIRSWIMGYAGK